MHDKNTNFVIAILHQGKVLREAQGTVFLPFHSEYTVRVKNPTGRRVGAIIDIDGSEIGPMIIVPSFSHVDISRMILDMNLMSGPALKFVPVGNSEVQDPISSENGKVTVRFYNEIIPSPPVLTTSHYMHNNMFWGQGQRSGTPDSVLKSASSALPDMHNMSTYHCCDDSYGSRGINISASMGSAGATVAGDTKVQQFGTTSFNAENHYCAQLTITLRGHDVPVQVEKRPKFAKTDVFTTFCTKCGKQISMFDNFCAYCGTKNKRVAIPK